MSLFGNCDPSYAAWQTIIRIGLASIYLTAGNTLRADLMSLNNIDGSGNPLWLFLSVNFGWIAQADIHTEKLRSLPIHSLVHVVDSLVRVVSRLVSLGS